VHIPVFSQMHERTIVESAFWRRTNEYPVKIAGIPPAKLFAGLTDSDVYKLYYNSDHMNENGMALFTTLMTPPLIELFTQQSD